MKLKKICSTLICQLTLLAMIGILSLEISSHSHLLNKKTEISASKARISNDLNLVFEEERDTDDQTDHTLLTQVYFNYTSLTQVHLINYSNNFLKTQVTAQLTKIPLFISIRTLRI